MNRLAKRVKKLEGGKGHIEVICTPGGLSGDEKDAIRQDHLRRKGLPPDTYVIWSRPGDERL
jgi:hypothetical protein